MATKQQIGLSNENNSFTWSLGLHYIENKITIYYPRELSSVGKGYYIVYVGARVRTPETPFLHILYVWALATRLLDTKKKITIY